MERTYITKMEHKFVFLYFVLSAMLENRVYKPDKPSQEDSGKLELRWESNITHIVQTQEQAHHPTTSSPSLQAEDLISRKLKTLTRESSRLDLGKVSSRFTAINLGNMCGGDDDSFKLHQGQLINDLSSVFQSFIFTELSPKVCSFFSS
ncbi:unnamed protein product [Eruca vesicaria subsp. sativa]|uniref:Uncharacterized protein n=1 Tax=Eruca vesicaria subsp. sativa TaxID=29727 RepID=A0ABC8LAU7_ERUVS|nr:unnamed protein product [Eruca vesicaria subsp. sativa]